MFGKKKVTETMIPREDGLTDYNVYIMSRQERIVTMILAAAVLFAVGYVFYHSIILSAFVALFCVKFPKIRTRQIIDKRKRQLMLQFKDMLYSLSSALSVGKSVETGIRDSLQDLRVIYPDPETDILRELEYILRGIGISNTIEEMFGQFAERADLEDIDNFVDIFVTCKRTGGDLIEVMRSTSNTIGEKIEVKQEINTMISGKKYEFNFMMVLPVILILFLTLTSGDYMAPVFQTIVGRLAMTAAIVTFVLAYVVGSRIMKIDI
ncbi:type II secretion system F family protein [Hungatella effluvii]|uniref:type II secretion system F family protein n=1 Tax=Hungatella effluvii TaxID=1096246 RepID=UPI0022E8392D|nr:type II secretion system F family protein [Hungatella effluvii]